jgi:hypothetical protein
MESHIRLSSDWRQDAQAGASGMLVGTVVVKRRDDRWDRWPAI